MPIEPRAVIVAIDPAGNRRDFDALIVAISVDGVLTLADVPAMREALRQHAIAARAAELHLEYTAHAAEALSRAFAEVAPRLDAMTRAGREIARQLSKHAHGPRSKGDRHRNRRHRWSMPR